MARSLERMPSRFELGVALEVARLVSADGVDDLGLIASFEHISSGGLIRVQHLTEATKLLAVGGLLARTRDGWRAEDLLSGVGSLSKEEGVISLISLLLSRAPPMWLAGATVGAILNIDLIPDADWTALCGAIADSDRREAVLRSVGRRLDDPIDGAASEGAIAHVVEECRRRLAGHGRADLTQSVLRVASDDHLGYDVICPTLKGECWRLKVLAGRRGFSQLTMNISRDDVHIGVGKAGWALVVCQRSSDGLPQIAGWCREALLRDHLPDDSMGRGEWVTARLFIDEQDLDPDFPDLADGPV